MIRPSVFLISVAVIALMAIALVFALRHPRFKQNWDEGAETLRQYQSPTKTVTVAFLDVSESDTTRQWLPGSAARNLFVEVLAKHLHHSGDIFSAFLLHAYTKDNQPFWTNHAVGYPEAAQQSDSGRVVRALRQRKACLEAFDSLAFALQFVPPNAFDSLTFRQTDVIGAIQQAALDFRRHANPYDRKVLYFFSDMRENAATGDAQFKLENLASKNEAIDLAEKLSLRAVSISTDVRDELRGAEVTVLSPNNRFYSNDQRNLRRIFWERFFYKLNVRSVYFF